jgi:predicted RNA binding protein YcfA (HicA-like mRNA interferase family)
MAKLHVLDNEISIYNLNDEDYICITDIARYKDPDRPDYIIQNWEMIKLIETDGWYLVTTKGSHRQYKHPEKSGRITIAGHLADDLAPGTMNSIFKQARIMER